MGAIVGVQGPRHLCPNGECAAFAIYVPLSNLSRDFNTLHVRIQESVRRLQYRTGTDDKGGCRET